MNEKYKEIKHLIKDYCRLDDYLIENANGPHSVVDAGVSLEYAMALNCGETIRDEYGYRAGTDIAMINVYQIMELFNQCSDRESFLALFSYFTGIDMLTWMRESVRNMENSIIDNNIPLPGPRITSEEHEEYWQKSDKDFQSIYK